MVGLAAIDSLTSTSTEWVSPRAAISLRMLRTSSRADSTLGSATNDPTPCTRVITPALVSSRMARFTVMRDTPNFMTRSFSLGRRLCGG